MLKVLDPFFKNKPDGYFAPVKIHRYLRQSNIRPWT